MRLVTRKDGERMLVGKMNLWKGLAGVPLAVVLMVAFVGFGAGKESETKGKSAYQGELRASRTKDDPADTTSLEPTEGSMDLCETKEGVREQVQSPVPLSGQAQHQTDRVPKETEFSLPEVPTVLVVVYGEQSMTALVRAHVESVIRKNGLPVASVSEIPVLREKMQFGDVPISWYSIREYVPPKQMQILLLAEVQRMGSTSLNYYGKSEQMATAILSIRVMDLATGVSAAQPASGSVKFTSLNMEEKFRNSISSAVSHMGAQIKDYWQRKRRATEAAE